MHLSEKDLDKLLQSCLKNDRKAQESLYKLFYEDMCRVCYRYLNSWDLAAEVLNTAFLKVFTGLSAFDRHKGHFEVWIRTIVIRCAIDFQRKELRFKHQELENIDSESLFVHPDVLDRLNLNDLQKTIDELPDTSRVVFNLSVIDGYSHKEIAEQLNISEGTSRWHLSEAKKRLKDLLSKSTDHPHSKPLNHRPR